MAVPRPDPRDDIDDAPGADGRDGSPSGDRLGTSGGEAGDDGHGHDGHGHDGAGHDGTEPPEHVTIVADPPTLDEVHTEVATDRPGWHVRLFGSHEFFRLWLVQVVSALGDWLGFSAIILLAARIGGGAGAGAISLVMAARIVPGFFFGPVAGVLVDRWDRKRVMVTCDLGRAAVLCFLPFVGDVIGLVLASLVLEVFTLLWSPAKDSEVPNLVPRDHLTTANSLSLAAAYGTFPVASALFALLAWVSIWIGSVPGLGFLDNNQMALAFYVDVLTFCFSAWMISRLPLLRRPPRQLSDDGEPLEAAGFRATVEELREGWRMVVSNHTVRAVNLGLATGLIGGGMLIPLGAVFSTEVLGAGAAGYGLFTTALGFGVAAGVVAVSALQKRVPRTTVFTGALFCAGISLFLAATASTLPVAVAFVFLMGVSVGPVYVLGFVLLQEEVPDEMRGRVFSSLNTLVRLCVLISMVAGPLLAALLGQLSEALVDGQVDLRAGTLELPGVRLALWLAALIIVAAGIAAMASLRSGQREQRAGASPHPSRHSR